MFYFSVTVYSYIYHMIVKQMSVITENAISQMVLAMEAQCKNVGYKLKSSSSLREIYAACHRLTDKLNEYIEIWRHALQAIVVYQNVSP